MEIYYNIPFYPWKDIIIFSISKERYYNILDIQGKIFYFSHFFDIEDIEDMDNIQDMERLEDIL